MVTLALPLCEKTFKRFDDCRAGVSLIEVLLVLIISAGVLVLSPSLLAKVRGDRSLDLDGELVLQTLQLARETAVTSGCQVSVAATMAMRPGDPPGLLRPALVWQSQRGPYTSDVAVSATPAVYSTGGSTDPIWLSTETVLRGAASPVMFQPDGTAASDQQWMLDNGAAIRRIRVRGLTGQITLEMS